MPFERRDRPRPLTTLHDHRERPIRHPWCLTRERLWALQDAIDAEARRVDDLAIEQMRAYYTNGRAA